MSNRVKVNLLGCITVLIWATAFPLTRMINGDYSSSTIALLRCIFASVFLLAISRLTGIRRPKDLKTLGILVITGFSGFGAYLVCFSKGLETITSSTSSIVLALTPVLTSIGASIVFKEKVSRTGWACIAVAFISVVVMIAAGGDVAIGRGILWTCGASFLFCIYNLTSRRIIGTCTSIEIVTYSLITASIMLLIFSPGAFAEIQSASIRPLILVAFLGIFPSATGYALWSKALSYAEKTSEVTNYMFVTPFVATVYGVIMLREFPDFLTIVCGLIIIGCVILFSLDANRSK